MKKKARLHQVYFATDIDFDNTIVPYDPRIANQTFLTSGIVGYLEPVNLEDLEEEDDEEVFTREDFFKVLDKVSTPPQPD